MLAVVLGLFLCCSAEGAQIYALEFKDSASAKKFEKYHHPWNGRQVILVELKTELMRDSAGRFLWQSDDRIEFYIQNRKDPLDLPYSVSQEGQKKPRKRSLIITLQGAQFAGLIPFMEEEDFSSLAKEYQSRQDFLEELAKQRSREKAKSVAWEKIQMHYIQQLGSLAVWLQYTGFFDAVPKVERSLMRENRRSSNEDNLRLQEALDSVRFVPVDPELNHVAERIGGGGLEFRSLESTHMKFLYHGGIPDRQIVALAELGETVIDGFRTEFVDPYLSDGFADEIPDEIFVQFFFSTDQEVHYERLYEDYLQGDWGEGERRENLLKLNGKWTYFENTLLSFWRTTLFSDLEGRVVHGLGHRLAALHYQVHQDSQDWLEEAVGYYLSLEFLNKNSITCFDFHRSKAMQGHTVAKGNPREASAGEYGEIFIGKRESMAKDAIGCQLPFSRLIPLRKYDFRREEFSKAWALFTFLAESKGQAGQEWLRGLSEIVDSGDFQSLLQEHTRSCFEFENSIPLQKMEQEWSSFMRQNYDV